MNGQRTWVAIIISLGLLLLYSILFPFPPQTILIRFTALAGFFLLCVTLLIGPAFVCIGDVCAPAIKHRRRIGVLSFIFVLIHFLLVMVYSYNFSLLPIFSSIWIVIAVPAFIILLVLAITSFNKVIQVFGFSSWKLLQRLVYLAFILSFLHFVFNIKDSFIALPDGRIFVNLAEMVVIILGIATIVLQIVGFAKKTFEPKKSISKKEVNN